MQIATMARASGAAAVRSFDALVISIPTWLAAECRPQNSFSDVVKTG
ncbi:MAG TPA: hypothetical protein VN047_09050 [Sphingopyxis sp.]|nr:hypothetical protein [Sphingopyxis sp.]HWW57026.1 hypothetical protein [Sphingopyxis sp.]